MAMFTGTTHVYAMAGSTGVGNAHREDLTDLITNISPTETPFTSAIGKVPATAVLHEWLTDELAAAANNAHIEGNEITFSTASSTTRLTNYCQISVKSVITSGTEDAVKKAGMGKQLAYQVAKRTKEIARDMEVGFLQNTSLVTGDATTARQAKGVAGFISTNQTDLGTGTVTVTNSHINSMLQDIWTEGGNPKVLSVGAFNKRTISAMTGSSTKNLDAKDHKLIQSIDIFESDFSILKVIPNRHQLADDVYALDMDLWKMAVLRPLKLVPLAKTGDADKRALIVECTLECRQEKGNGSIIDSATS